MEFLGRRLASSLVLTFLTWGPQPGAAQAPETVTVFAAASLTEAFTAIGRDFERAHPGVRVRFNFAGSQGLATQLAQGARADVFASADQHWMQFAIDRGLIAGSPRIFARNRLAVVVPRSNPGSIETLQDLARPGVKLVLAASQVPVGTYSREALARLAARAGFPPDYRERVLRNLVSEEENVKAVLAKVQLGEADAGLVYVTDLTPAVRSEVLLLEIPDPENPVASYPIATTPGAASSAEEFVRLVLSPAGQRALAARGFLAGVASDG